MEESNTSSLISSIDIEYECEHDPHSDLEHTSFSEGHSEYSEGQSEEDLFYEGPIQGYVFEPVVNVDDSLQPAEDANVSHESQSQQIDRRELDISEWCLCGYCSVMPSLEECICCQEINRVQEKCMEAEPDIPSCITVHPGFDAVALNVWNLQAVYFSYRQEYGHLQGHAVHERYRYTAYRHFVRWCWGYVGRHYRVHIPACAVMTIRNTFPNLDHAYTGFKYPNLE